MATVNSTYKDGVFSVTKDAIYDALALACEKVSQETLNLSLEELRQLSTAIDDFVGVLRNMEDPKEGEKIASKDWLANLDIKMPEEVPTE